LLVYLRDEDPIEDIGKEAGRLFGWFVNFFDTNYISPDDETYIAVTFITNLEKIMKADKYGILPFEISEEHLKKEYLRLLNYSRTKSERVAKVLAEVMAKMARLKPS